MKHYYSSERSIQILISLLKQHGIKKVIASPGTTNLTFVASIQQDPWFEIYSSVDERSAAYIACGMAAESGEPVVLTCTGATASRNYMPGLTEAYYRKLPVLAVTATQDETKIGHLIAQVIDRSSLPNDIALLSEHIPVTRDETDEWSNTVKINRALLDLRHRGGGPVHLNVTTTYSRDYSVEKLPEARMIRRICAEDAFPELPEGRIAVFVGAHRLFTEAETAAIDRFCASHDAVVFCDHTSGYNGKYRVQFSLVAGQDAYVSDLCKVGLLVHIGEVSGDYATLRIRANQVWRVNPDGALRDTFNRLTCVFEMSEQLFFEKYAGDAVKGDYLHACKNEYAQILQKIPELPFSNIWIAQHTASRIPEGAVVHLGILNTLRAWNMFEFPQSVQSNCNVGGFGIDGDVSALIGASLINPEKLYFGIVGDLAFFYDMNVVGNRHVGKNVRIMLINNGKGTEFRNYCHPGSAFGEDADRYIAAAGHYGNKSPELIKHYAQDLGYEYLTASNKEEFLQVYERFLTPEMTDKPMLFEIFTDNQDESDALKIVNNLKTDAIGKSKQIAKQILGETGKNLVKKIMK